MARKTFLIFWLLSLIPIILMGSVFYLYARSMSGTVTTMPLTAVWMVAILAGAMLAAIFWFIAAWLFKPLQQVTQTALLLAQKSSAKHAAAAKQPVSSNEPALLAQSLDQIADNWQEMEKSLQTQAAIYQDSLLALTQFAANAATPTKVSDAATDAAPGFDSLIAQALEIAVKHLGYAHAAFFTYAGDKTPARGAQPEPIFSLRSSVSAGSAATAAVSSTANQAPEAASEPLQSNLLRKAFLARQNHTLTHPDQESSMSGSNHATVTEIAIPIISQRQQQSSAEQVIGILYASYQSLQTSAAAPEIPITVKLPLTALNAVAQTLAALTGLGIAARIPGVDRTTSTSPYPATFAQETPTGDQTGGLSAATVQRRLAEFESLWKISQAISAETDLLPLYRLIHEQLTNIIGDMSSFAIVLYNQASEQLHIPYMISDGRFVTVPAFPLGQGLSSIVIRSGQPLLLAYSSAEKARELGAIFVGEPAKSWLGVPLIMGSETFGVIIVQDIHREGRFNEDDQRLLSLVAAQVAVVVRNARLIEETRRQASNQRQILEITDKIRRSVDTQAILKTTADELAAALNAQQADIQLYAGGNLDHSATDMPDNSTSEIPGEKLRGEP